MVFEGVLCGGLSGLGGMYYTILGSTEQRRRQRRQKCDSGWVELRKRRSGKSALFCTLLWARTDRKGKKWSVYGPISAARKTNPRFAKAVSLKLLVFRLL